MSEHIHDKGYKRILSKKRNFLNLLKNFVKESWINQITEDDLEIIDKEFIPKDFQERESDLIYKVKLKEREVIFYFMIEMQSTVDFTIPFRLLIYITELYKRLFLDTPEIERERKGFQLPAIIPCILYNGGSEWTAVKNFKEYLKGYDLFAPYIIDFEYILININQYSDDELMRIGNLISSVFVLDNKRSTFEITSGLTKVAKTFEKLEKYEQIELMDWLKDVLMKKVKLKKEKDLIDQMLEQLEKSEVINMTYTIERIWDEVEEKGIEKGIEEGKREGKEEGKKEVAVKLLKLGETIDKICFLTDLSKEEVYKLKEEI